MKACVVSRPRVVAISDWEDPEPRTGDLIVKVSSCGLCGTDRHIVDGSYPATYPNVLGHEISGTIEAVGDGVTGMTTGERVAVDPNIFDGTCPACRRGDVHLCEHLSAIGVTRPGGMAPYLRVPSGQAHAIPESLALADAAFAEPLSCIVHGLERVRLQLGGHVAVLGAGSIGLMMTQALRAIGAGTIVVSEPSDAKRALAETLGADEVYAPELIDHPSHESAYDLVVDCTGVPKMLAEDVRLARRGADILLFGVSPKGATTTVEPYALYQKELRLVASNINPYTMDKAIALLAGGIVKVADIISHPVGLDDLPSLLSAPPGPTEVKAALRFS